MGQTSEPPTVHVIAGPNGAGKTTFANRFLPDFMGCRQFVNADLIATGLSPFAPDTMALQAGRLMLERIETLAQQRATFGLETTLSGKTLYTRLKALKKAGYLIHLVYLWVDSPELAIARVAERVHRGGHSIPKETVRRRYVSGMHHLFTLYIPLADSWAIYDNSNVEPTRVAYRDAEGVHIEHQNLYEQIERMGQP